MKEPTRVKRVVAEAANNKQMTWTHINVLISASINDLFAVFHKADVRERRLGLQRDLLELALVTEELIVLEISITYCTSIKVSLQLISLPRLNHQRNQRFLIHKTILDVMRGQGLSIPAA